MFQNSGRKEAIEVQSSPVKDLRNKTMEESLKELRFSPVEGRLWSDTVLNMPSICSLPHMTFGTMVNRVRNNELKLQ